MTDIVTVSIACASEAEAATLARVLVENRLAACVQSFAVASTYRWQGAIETAPEVMLTAKTRVDKRDALEACVRALHSYEVPEIIAVPVVWASAPYAQWLNAALSPDE
jgi:uncharacterized protein involved in tolerance to divalent cations